MQKLTRRTYTETFRAEAVTLAQSSNEGVAAVARSLGVDVTTLRTWLHRAQQPSSDSETLTPSERKELADSRSPKRSSVVATLCASSVVRLVVATNSAVHPAKQRVWTYALAVIHTRRQALPT